MKLRLSLLALLVVTAASPGCVRRNPYQVRDGGPTSDLDCASDDDPHHCGACGNDCTNLPGVAAVSCIAAQCVIDTCLPGRADCTSDPGCETDITTSSHCGSCTLACSPAASLCMPQTGSCVATCAGLTPTQCATSCVDTTSDVDNCGACGQVCPALAGAFASCVASMCQSTCTTGYHACGGQCVANTSVLSCGSACSACPQPAHANATCDGASCGFTCAVGFVADNGTCHALSDMSAPPIDMACAGAAASALHYVDPQFGADDLLHGGGAGACAFKTVQFALANSSGSISLATATYAVTSATALTLRGVQQLQCNGATLRGDSTISGSSAVVTLAGTAAVLSDCFITGGSGACVDVLTGSSNSIVGSDLSSCFTGLYGGGVTLSKSSIHNTSYGTTLYSATVLSQNTFANNSVDIDCGATTPVPVVTGTGNSDNGAAPSCRNCLNCPFR